MVGRVQISRISHGNSGGFDFDDPQASAPVSIPGWGGHTYEQQVVVKQPALWSPEERNRYKLVTEVEVGGQVADRYGTPFGIRTVRFEAEKGFFLNGKSAKVKGTCNHQDHAGL